MRRAPGQASIEEHPRGSGRYRVRARIEGRLRTVASGITLAEAEEAAAAYTVLRNEEVVREGVTLAQFGIGFLNRRERRGVRGIKQERARWSAYVDAMAIGQLPVATIRRRDIVDWCDELGARGLADQTRRNALNLLRAALADAVDRELLAANPARDVKIRSSGTQAEDLSGVLRPAEQIALLQACPDSDRPVVLFALLTGLRLSEQWWLRWEDVRDDHILVRRSVGGRAPKSGKPRRVPLLPLAQQILEGLPRSSPWVFPAPRGGRRHAPQRPRGWHTALAAVELGRRIRWHDLRHTCGTSLLAGWWGRRWTLEEVRRFLGHSTVKVTERYARILDESVTEAAAATSEFPASSQLGALLVGATASKQLRRGPDSNRRITVLQSDPDRSDITAIEASEFPIGNTYTLPVLALAETALRLGLMPQEAA